MEVTTKPVEAYPIDQWPVVIVHPTPSSEVSPNEPHNEQPVSAAVWPSPVLQAPNFCWGPYDGQTFTGIITAAYNEVVQAPLVKLLCQSLLNFCKLLLMDQA